MVKQQHPAFNCRGSVSIFTESISVIKKFFISNNKLAPLCLFLAEWFAKGNTIFGTCSFHHFIWVCVVTLKFKHTSMDAANCGMHSFRHPVMSHVDVTLMSYVACFYDDKWWVGSVDQVDSRWCKHKLSSSQQAFWSVLLAAHEDHCWVPLSCIICKVNQPEVVVAVGMARTASLKYRVEQMNVPKQFTLCKAQQQLWVIHALKKKWACTHVLRFGGMKYGKRLVFLIFKANCNMTNLNCYQCGSSIVQFML